jgi:hypothetical protein
MYGSRLSSALCGPGTGGKCRGHRFAGVAGGKGPNGWEWLSLRACFPGQAGHLQVVVRALRSGDLRGDVVQTTPAGATPKQRMGSAG